MQLVFTGPGQTSWPSSFMERPTATWAEQPPWGRSHQSCRGQSFHEIFLSSLPSLHYIEYPIYPRKSIHFSFVALPASWSFDEAKRSFLGKRTRFLYFGVDLSHMASYKCVSAKRGFCAFSGSPHIPWMELSPDGQFMTKIAEPFPFLFCRKISQAFLDWHSSVIAGNFWKRLMPEGSATMGWLDSSWLSWVGIDALILPSALSGCENIFASFASSWHPTGRGNAERCHSCSWTFLTEWSDCIGSLCFNSQASQPTLPGLKSGGLASMLWFCRVLSLDVKNIFASFASSWHPTGRGKCWAVWLLWFLVLDLTTSERFKHVQSKHQNVTKHQHDFCVGDLNMNMCCSNTETHTRERGDWVGTDSGKRCDLASASCARCPGTALGWGRSILVTVVVGLHLCQSVWIMFLVLVGEGSPISVHIWWDFHRFGFFHPESRRCTMSCPKWNLCKWETDQRHVHFRGDWHGSGFRDMYPLLGDLEAVTFTPNFCRSCATASAVFATVRSWNVGNLYLINPLGSMLSWRTTLSFFQPFARFVFFGVGFVADWTLTRVLASLLNTKISAKLECALTSSIPDTRNKHDEFLLLLLGTEFRCGCTWIFQIQCCFSDLHFWRLV